MKFILFDRRLIKDFDWIIFVLTLAISAVGIVVIYSATGVGLSPSNLYIKQIYWVCYGIIAMMLVITIDYHQIERLAHVLYLLMIVMLVLVLFHGKVAGGAQRWLSLGFFNIQPSELSKVIIVIFLARYFDENRSKSPYRLRNLIVPAFFVMLPFWLIAKQPDLGTAIIFLLIFALVALIVGIRRKSLYCLAGAAVITLPSLWFFLKDYQKTRILTLVYPGMDPLGAGYHAIQSKIAIGSGRMFGKGLLSGTQSQLNFLPEKHTDFIFSVFSEELGFMGAMFFILALTILVLKGLDVVYNAKDISGAVLSAGAVAIIGGHAITNIAMTTGLFPIVGTPLPFMSYGGSFTLTTFLCVGLLLNVSMRKHTK